MESKEQVINSVYELERYKRYLDEMFNNHKYLRVSLRTGKQRSGQQNKALHVYCRLVADALNDAGYDFRLFLKEGYPVPFTPELVKDHFWRPVQKALTGKESTTKPERAEYTQIYEVLNRKLAEHGIHVPWPSNGGE